MRVLNIFPVSEIGGAEMVFLNLIRYRERSDIHHQAVLVADKDGPLGEALTRLGVRWQRVPRGRMRHPRLLWGACRDLRRVVRDSGADVILANSPQGFLYARWAMLGCDMPIALYYMTVPHARLLKNNKLDVLMALARPSAIFTASKTIARIVQGWGLSRVQAVYHGTPVQPVQPTEIKGVELTLAHHGVPPAAPVILLPGRLQPWKGQHVLIAALPAVLQACPQAHAMLLGGTLFGMSTDYPNQLRRQIAELSLEGRVHIAGHHPIRGWLERAAVVVHASTEPDPFPNVCIEALAARRPLVTNTLAGTCEILTDGVDALTVQSNDPPALAAAIIKLLNDPAAAASIAAAGHRRYQATCTPIQMVRPIETALASLLEPSRRSRALKDKDGAQGERGVALRKL